MYDDDPKHTDSVLKVRDRRGPAIPMRWRYECKHRERDFRQLESPFASSIVRTAHLPVGRPF